MEILVFQNVVSESTHLQIHAYFAQAHAWNALIVLISALLVQLLLLIYTKINATLHVKEILTIAVEYA